MNTGVRIADSHAPSHQVPGLIRTTVTVLGLSLAGATLVATLATKDSAWFLHAFRRLGIHQGTVALILYGGLALVWPSTSVFGICWALARRTGWTVFQGLLLGLGSGICLNHALLVLADAGPVAAAPGMPVSLGLLGEERLAVVLAGAMVINLAAYGVIGSLAGWGVASILSTPAIDGRRRVHPRSRGLVLCTILVLSGAMIAGFWRIGPGADGLRAFLGRFDLAPGVRCEESRVFHQAGSAVLRVDVCGPTQATLPAPAVICVHGGGWHGGNRDECFPLLVRLARRGYVAAAPDYRLAPANRFPVQWDDLAAAIDWIVEGDCGFGVDATRLAAVGWSAGGHLASLLGTGIGEWPATALDDQARRALSVRAVVALSAITDLTSPVWRETRCGSEVLLGCSPSECPGSYRAASPVHEVTRESPPFLLIHGDADSVVPIEQSRSMAQALRAAGVEVSLFEVPGVGHRWYGAAWREAYDDAERFLAVKLGERPSKPNTP